MKRLVPALSQMVMVLMLLAGCGGGGGSTAPGGGTTTDTTAPSTPAGFVAAAASSSSIALNWTASTDNTGVTGYKIYRGGTQISTSTINAFSDSGLSASTSYAYTVAAYDAAGNTSAQSTSALATTLAAGVTDATAPTVPTNLTATVISTTQINLAWTASTDNIGVAGYEVWRGATKITTVTTTSYSDTGLTASTVYTYTVKAFDGAANVSAASNSATATTQAIVITDTTAPSVPTNLVTTATSSSQINLTWTASTDAVGVTGYKIYRGGTYLKSATAISSSDTSLTAATQYCYQVTAYDAAGNESAKSAQACATTSSGLPVVATGKVPDTGQTTSYTNTFGEDADYTINAPSYTDNGDGTITDNITGLVWQKQDDSTARVWADATAYCSGLTLSGASWRLPTDYELMTIVDYGKNMPAVDTSYFTGTHTSYYWSSTSVSNNTASAWLLDFASGDSLSDLKTDSSYGGSPFDTSYYTRCVRGSQSVPVFTDAGNGTIFDDTTKLTWQQTASASTWDSALTYCEGLTLGGSTDWRLPNIKELKSLADMSRYNPAIDATYFPTVGSMYWSSTSRDTDAAWYVTFANSGGSSLALKVGGAGVRCVRGGQ